MVLPLTLPSQAAKLLDGVTYCNDPYEALDGASAAVIVTEWDAFRALDFKRMGELLADRLLVDLRNVYDPKDMAQAGFRYSSIGRPSLPPSGGPTAGE